MTATRSAIAIAPEKLSSAAGKAVGALRLLAHARGAAQRHLQHGQSCKGARLPLAFTPRLALELVLLALLFASVVSSVMSVRHYSHVVLVLLAFDRVQPSAWW